MKSISKVLKGYLITTILKRKEPRGKGPPRAAQGEAACWILFDLMASSRSGGALSDAARGVH